MSTIQQSRPAPEHHPKAYVSPSYVLDARLLDDDFDEYESHAIRDSRDLCQILGDPLFIRQDFEPNG